MEYFGMFSIYLIVSSLVLQPHGQGLRAPGSGQDRPSVLGRVVTDRTIRLEATVDRPPDEVFRLWTTVEGVRTFFCSDARIASTPGGPYEIYFLPPGDPMHDAASTQGAHLLSMEAPHFLSFEWKGKPGMEEMRRFPLPTWVELTFDPVGPDNRRTRVRLAHFGFGEGAAWDEAFAYFGEQAWPLVLRRLTAACADGKALPKAAAAKHPKRREVAAGDLKASPKRQYLAAFVTRGPKWTPPERWDPQMTTDHLAYMRRLAAAGHVLMAGPFSDESGGGLTILSVASVDEGRRLMEADPCVRSGVLQVEVHPWDARIASDVAALNK